ncbi:MAG: DUF3037 domain-containing protein [Candidatus Sumerlaeia bacterium]|nr:DUF3037 domain-containing protein [Candidatus Sumerlaeia bacterium]
MQQSDILTAPGYYSLVQYRPDPLRLEAATVGLLLVCPNWNFVNVKTADSLARLEKFFGPVRFDREKVRGMLDALEERTKVMDPDLRTLEDLEKFVALRANEVILTPPRTTKITNPEKDFQRLLNRALGKVPRTRREPSKPDPVKDLFEQAIASGKQVERSVKVDLGLGGRTFEAPYGYQNGTFNLVKPFNFAVNSAIPQTERLAFECQEVAERRTPQGREQRVLVIAPHQDIRRDIHWNEIRAVLEKYQARVEDDLKAVKRELENL